MFNVLDNWLPDSLVDEINNVFTSDKVQWVYKPATVNPEDVEELKFEFPNIEETHQFVHMLYYDNEVKSMYWEIVRPLLHFYEYHRNCKIVELGRIKANMLFQDSTSTTTHNTPHVDRYDDGWTSLVYYVNNSDGDTVMFNDSLENIATNKYKQGSATYFSSNIWHSSTNPKDNYRRIVINMIFKEEKN